MTDGLGVPLLVSTGLVDRPKTPEMMMHDNQGADLFACTKMLPGWSCWVPLAKLGMLMLSSWYVLLNHEGSIPIFFVHTPSHQDHLETPSGIWAIKPIMHTSE